MTYVELIVVLSIFSVMTSVVLFDYRGFQGRVDVKVLANDIALKAVEAQRSAVYGELGTSPFDKAPSYGLRFNVDSTTNKRFIYFADFNNNDSYNGPAIGNSTCDAECLDKIDITKGNYISGLRIVGAGCPATVNNINVTFQRPSSTASFRSNPPLGLACDTGIEYLAVDISSPNALGATIQIYASGRIQIE